MNFLVNEKHQEKKLNLEGGGGGGGSSAGEVRAGKRGVYIVQKEHIRPYHNSRLFQSFFITLH